VLTIYHQEVPRLDQSAIPVYPFSGSAPLPLEARFDGGRLTSDGGLPWLERADTVLGLTAAVAAVIPEWRHGPVRHSRELLVRQRVFQIACGDEDQDDADTLRIDPLRKLVGGQLPETGRDLASQPTLSRLENAVDRKRCDRLAVALGEISLREREREGIPTHIILIDATLRAKSDDSSRSIRGLWGDGDDQRAGFTCGSPGLNSLIGLANDFLVCDKV
jgi:hypothetical protein